MKEKKRYSSSSQTNRNQSRTPNIPHGKVTYRGLNVSPDNRNNFSGEKERSPSIIKENTNSYIESPLKSNIIEGNKNGRLIEQNNSNEQSP